MTHNVSPLTTDGDRRSRMTDRLRLQIDLRDPGLMDQLKEQAAQSDQSVTTLVNDALDRFLAQPSVFSNHPAENLGLMFEYFESLPMDQIHQLAQTSHRQPDQMLIHLLMKGLKAYTAVDDNHRD